MPDESQRSHQFLPRKSARTCVGLPIPESKDVDMRADEWSGAVNRQAIASVRQLSQLRTIPMLLGIATQWSVIGVSAVIAVWSAHWAVYVLAAVVIATRQHALGVLLHEAAHWHLCRSKPLNDLVADLLFGLPFNMSIELYRRQHFQHHRHTNTPDDPQIQDSLKDPDWPLPATFRSRIRVFAKDLVGMNALAFIRITSQWNPLLHWFARDQHGRRMLPPAHRWRALVFIAAVLATLTATHLWIPYLVLWIAPGATVVVSIFRIRTVAEHIGLPWGDGFSNTRTVIPRLWERLILAPCQVNYHIEHHLYPAVPFYHLPRLHRMLMEDPDFAARAIICRGYTNVVPCGQAADLAVQLAGMRSRAAERSGEAPSAIQVEPHAEHAL